MMLAPGTARAIISYDKLHELQQDEDSKDDAKNESKLIARAPQLHYTGSAGEILLLHV